MSPSSLADVVAKQAVGFRLVLERPIGGGYRIWCVDTSSDARSKIIFTGTDIAKAEALVRDHNFDVEKLVLSGASHL